MKIKGWRRFAGFSLVFVALIVAWMALRPFFRESAPVPKQEIPRKAQSFVLITLDTTRADRLSSYGAEDVETPAMESLAKRGVLFENAYAVAPITLVSHTSMLTGLNPPRHGIRNNGIHHVADEITTISEILRDEGFRTAAFVSAAVLDHRYGLDQGFEVFDDDLSQGGNRRARMVPDRPAGSTVDAAQLWLDEIEPDERFFLWVHFYDPHAVYSPPPPFRDTYRERPYDGEIAYMDSQIGRFLQHPRLADEHDVGVIVVGDHGESLGEHGEETHALLAYDSTLHVPLILRTPGGPEGCRSPLPTGGADIAPTILDLLNQPIPTDLDGMSIATLLAEPKNDRALYAETYLPYYTYGWAKLKVFRRGGFKLILGPGNELYDTNRDPLELTNLIDRYPNEAHDLIQLLQEYEAQWGDAEHEASMTLDQESMDQLRSLGYLAIGSGPEKIEGERPNPRDMVDLHVGLERARRFASSELYSQAIAQLRLVLERDPGNLAALIDLATNLLEIDELDEAAEIAQEAISRDPNYSRSYILMAAIEIERRHPEKALVLLNSALEIDPRHVEALLRKAHLLKRIGRLSEMRGLLEAALVEQPDQPNLEITYAKLIEIPSGKDSAAEERIRKALARDPYIATGWKILGEILLKQGRETEALDLYREGLSRKPDSHEIHADLGLLLAKLGQGGKAVPHLREAIRLGPVFRSDLHVALGAIASQGGGFEEAQRHYDLILEKEPNHPATRNNRAIALYRLGRFREAKEELESVLKENPNYADAANNMAAIAVDLGDWTAAERWALRTLELEPRAYEAWNNLGVAHDESGNHQQARKDFEKALDIQPDYQPAKINLGITLARMGLSREAAAVFEQALAAGPADPTINLELGDLYAGPLANMKRARAHYNAFIAVAPNHPRATEIRRTLSTLSAPDGQ
ncbi:MAG: sulfatase-like hydrolase/transferase [Thermoanaerobaculales bacterium]|nr:sulfatase-like hydrolase/transferase [Thermoanaerobaculales bacterium]